jgi:hypothetical protein
LVVRGRGFQAHCFSVLLMRRDNHVATTVLIPLQFLCSSFELWVVRDRGFQAHGFLFLLMHSDNNTATTVLILILFLFTP